jgi:hypothetical protein
MYMVDLIGCANEDIPPFFPFHSHLIPLEPDYPSSTVTPLHLQCLINPISAASPALIPILNLFTDIARFSILLETTIRTTDSAVWKDLTWCGQHIQPLTYRLLTLRSPTNEIESSFATHEMLRLALMLYLTPIRRSFGIYPVNVDIHVAKLWALIQDPATGMLCDELRIWTVVMGAMDAKGVLRDALTMELRDVVSGMGIGSCCQAEEILKSVVLMEVHGPGLRTLWADIEMQL